MKGTQDPPNISTKLLRIAELAKKAPQMAFTNLAHHIDVEFLKEAFRRTRKDGATGVDEVTAEEYSANLETNLVDLHERFKSGSYRAPPVKRAYVPKGDNDVRPIGIPTLEDKLLQRAVVMVLEQIYEQDFLPVSFAYRRKRSQHDALAYLRSHLVSMGGGMVIELDVSKFFDTLVHGHLNEFLDQRVRDGVIRRTIGKWLNAGVLEEGVWSSTDAGTPQGGVISPLLANIYLHEVLDKWFEHVVKPLLDGPAHLVRFADDAVIVTASERDALRVMNVLPKRFTRFGLTVHPRKTRQVPFRHPWKSKEEPGTFDFLGFTHFWGKTRKGGWAVKVKTAKDRFKRALKRVTERCRKDRHLPVGEQAKALGQIINGHCWYFGRTGNSYLLQAFAQQVKRIWRKWLGRRSDKHFIKAEHFAAILEAHPLPNALCYRSCLRPVANP